MKRFRLVSVLMFLTLHLGLVATPVQATIYQDVLTVTTVGLYNPDGIGNDPTLNVLGLNLATFGDSFDLILTYDSDTWFNGMGFGVFSFGQATPTNTMSMTMAGSISSVTFNETNDNLYSATPPIPIIPVERFQGPQANYIPGGAFDPANSVWSNVKFAGGISNVLGMDRMVLYLDENTENGLRIYDGSTGLFVELAVDYAGFDPAVDRTAVPIPGSLLLLAPGLLTLLGLRRRQAKHQ